MTLISRKLAIFLLLLSYGVAASSQDSYAPDLDRLIESFPAVQQGHVGYRVIDLKTGDILAEHDAASFFTPASNTKLYTTALALTRLGPNYKFATELRTTGAWLSGETVVPDIQLIGGGDPNLSGRALPYAVDTIDGDPLVALEELADKLAAADIREVAGDVTGVATRYPGDPYPAGWTINDSVYEYGAPVTALALNDNSASVTVRPTDAGDMAEIDLQPGCAGLIILNQVVTDDSDAVHIRVLRPEQSDEIVLWGTIGKNATEWKQSFATIDPALFAARALVDILRERGIKVRGEARSSYCGLNEIAPSQTNCSTDSERGSVIAIHESAPLAQVIQVVNKVSQNLHAEMLLREVGYLTGGSGTLEKGVDERERFLNEIGVPDIPLADGSGLARQDLTTPDATVALLAFMWQQQNRDFWLASLPIGGTDGTLEHRFSHVPGAERVHAKTGSLAHVNALSGYIQEPDQDWLAFSVMVNATNANEREVRDFLDSFCGVFLNK
ncbi:MAG: D-alanyl-D-alanine carboxypeptidase/D-alanyl-D-alanine-endopeptidase [Acidobacteriaceae bacterium]|nr:D-alanyl-D-alanine carboxypeptidase/D-alanyl-D-alanine-endopeptidase [Acidobacteriaceae bacterium]